MANFDLNMEDQFENFRIHFGELVYLMNDDFNALRNRPSYDGQTMTGDTNIPRVATKVSELENDSDYQTGEEVEEIVATKQDKLTAGANINISNQNVISATDTTYSAGNGINISGQNAISVDTTIVATQQNLSNEVSNRENADIYLQQQIDGIAASSDVVDIVGTYAELQAYDTQHLKDNDIIKVLQDETQNNATTYYRWSTTTETFTLIGQEGPYYTKASADSTFVPQTRTVNGKALSTNITLNASDVSALGTSDVVQTTGSSTSQVMSQNAVTQELTNKLNVSDYVVDAQLANTTNPVQNQVLNGLLGDMPTDFFSGSATTSPEPAREIQLNNALCLDDMQLLGDTTQQTYSGKNLFKVPDTATRNGVTLTHNADGTFNISGTATADTIFDSRVNSSLPSGTYTLSKTGNNSDLRIVVQDYSDTSWISNLVTIDSASQSTVTISPTGTRTGFVVMVLSGVTINLQNVEVQLESGSSATTWEPFTNGQNSPSPDYPQDINVVTGEQNVWVHGKNLMPFTNQDFTANGVRYYVTNGTLYANGTSSGETGSTNNIWKTNLSFTLAAGTYTVTNVDKIAITANIRRLSDNQDLAGGSITSGNYTRTFTLTEETECYLGFYQYNVSYTNQKFAIQIESGSVPATTYEPYQGQNYTIDLGATELAKIGTYQDYIYKSGDDWYVHKAIGKYAFTGSEDIRKSGVTANNSYYYAEYLSPDFGFADIDKTIISASTITPIYSDYFLGATTNNITNNDVTGLGFRLEGGVEIQCRMGFGKSSSITTAQLLATWLASNTPTVYYPLATPTETKITDATLISELEGVLNLECYDGQTNIVISASELAGILDIAAINANANGIIYKLRSNK